MVKEKIIVPETIDRAILFLGGKTFRNATRWLNQQVKRNIDRLPADFFVSEDG
jgi:hypothetical protein